MEELRSAEVDRYQGLLDRATRWAKERLPDLDKGDDLKHNIQLMMEYNARREIVVAMKRDSEGVAEHISLKQEVIDEKRAKLEMMLQSANKENSVVYAKLKDTKSGNPFFTVVRIGAHGELVAEERRSLPENFRADVVDESIISQARLFPDGTTMLTLNFTELDVQDNPHLIASKDFPRTALKVFNFLVVSAGSQKDSI